MKVEAKLYLFLVIFFAIVSPIYAYTTFRLDGAVEVIGTTVFILTFAMVAMTWAYIAITGRTIDERYEDDKDAEVFQGAGELGFFPPKSIWPFWCSLTLSIVLLGPVFGWWLTILGLGLGIWAVCGWVYEFYVGEYAH